MQNFKLNEEFLLNNQDWTFPTFTAYGPGRFKEIGNFCKNFKINNGFHAIEISRCEGLYKFLKYDLKINFKTILALNWITKLWTNNCV